MFIHIHPEGVPCPAKSGNHGAIIQGMAEDDSLFLPSHYNNGTVTPRNLLPLQAGLSLKNAIPPEFL